MSHYLSLFPLAYILSPYRTLGRFRMISSAPARVASSFILVVALAAFNVYVSKDLPKLSYTTFMDQ